MSFQDDNNIPYVSSAPDLIQEDKGRPVDEQELSTLLEVLEINSRAMDFFTRTSSLTLDPEIIKLFGVEAQLAINEKVIQHINTIDMKMRTAIYKVKETQNGREY